MQKEQLSAYMDGEQVKTDLTDALLRDEELQASWHSFHTVRSVMRKESAVFLGGDFTAKMADLIELEDVKKVDVIAVSQPEPEDAHNSAFMQKLKAFFAPMTQVAVAAGVCLVAVLGVQSFNSKNEASNLPEAPVLQTLPFNNAVQEISYNAPSKDTLTSDQLEKKSRRIGAMLQNYELQRRMHSDALDVSSSQVR
ncbi:TPA: RseA family anti-sigma factor [Haemophilus influenzae]|uniref:sigma-E factor negative regulatory protein n=1 Tax=Haemophilus TaxID=724 RepID=UPI0001A3F923|nr:MULTISPECIES: sigma-E factor negative regulatory protein [Haemophilus]AVI95785.1 anti sigma-E RseA, N-terminal domain protein [Haemophilus influenzae]AVI97558.1 anti sigma-E RseA, N-terminal domain protein [Haemophilus influenzae]AVJ02996.1 anti sigma-E RseA, N-terminal domain protein [Haemophilus influenzae]AVJ04739.1 anti sigma-E RseA, N-terminal domain protein [Haemophilus influenzae]AVJ06578.1 anti sigma-E RseA, N-terminal domain protein [Haemophilus influenzae]